MDSEGTGFTVVNATRPRIDSGGNGLRTTVSILVCPEAYTNSVVVDPIPSEADGIAEDAGRFYIKVNSVSIESGSTDVSHDIESLISRQSGADLKLHAGESRVRVVVSLGYRCIRVGSAHDSAVVDNG